MSSSNAVRLAFIEETTYGATPGSGSFNTARFISEGLSGTPDTVESQQIRTDRLSSGQIVVGLKVEGEVGFELAKEAALDLIIASAMYSSWDTQTLQTVDLSIDVSAATITRASGSFNTAPVLVPGDIIKLAAFGSALNNVEVMVSSVTSNTVIKFVGPEGMTTQVGTSTTYKRADKISISTVKKSFSLEKAFTDLTEKAIIYRGMIASQLSLNFAYGELAKGTYTLSGNDYETVDDSSDFITDGRTITPAATTQTLNGSVDMPFLGNDSSGNFIGTGLDIRSVGISLNNNLNPQNVIGDIAPKDYSAGTAQVEVNMSVYNGDSSWSILANKLTQTPFALGFMVKNAGGYYGVYMPAVQVSFEDPSSGGQNQDITLDMKGVAKVGALGQSSLTLYRG